MGMRYNQKNEDIEGHVRRAPIHPRTPINYLPVAGGTYPFGAGKSFLFCFKLVDNTDFASPEPSKSPAVTISKNGGAFASLTGTPAVSEISNGWYKVTVPAADMVSGVVVLKAIDTGTAQEDFVIYMA